MHQTYKSDVKKVSYSFYKTKTREIKCWYHTLTQRPSEERWMRKWLFIITGSRCWVLVKETAGERLWQSKARDRERSTMSEFRRIMMSSFLMLLLHFPGEDAENTHCLRLLMKGSEAVFQLKSMYPWARCLTPSRFQWGTVCEWYLLSFESVSTFNIHFPLSGLWVMTRLSLLPNKLCRDRCSVESHQVYSLIKTTYKHEDKLPRFKVTKSSP